MQALHDADFVYVLISKKQVPLHLNLSTRDNDVKGTSWLRHTVRHNFKCIDFQILLLRMHMIFCISWCLQWVCNAICLCGWIEIASKRWVFAVLKSGVAYCYSTIAPPESIHISRVHSWAPTELQCEDSPNITQNGWGTRFDHGSYLNLLFI